MEEKNETPPIPAFYDTRTPEQLAEVYQKYMEGLIASEEEPAEVNFRHKRKPKAPQKTTDTKKKTKPDVRKNVVERVIAAGKSEIPFQPKQASEIRGRVPEIAVEETQLPESKKAEVKQENKEANKKKFCVEYERLSFKDGQQNEYKKWLANTYAMDTYPRELAAAYKGLTIEKKESEFSSVEKLRQVLINKQILTTKNETLFHVCVDISGVPEQDAKEYRNCIVDVLTPENLAKENFMIICGNKTQAMELSTPVLKCHYI